jgi:CheY-like chemotaxis protein
VLVIDDNPEVIQLFQRYLGGGAYYVVGATTSQEALRLTREIRPHAITLDVMMPTQDGWEILQNLKNHPATKDIPVIVCSVLREHELALSLGAADFLAKPITQQMLLMALTRF